jgi:hypothetical protein
MGQVNIGTLDGQKATSGKEWMVRAMRIGVSCLGLIAMMTAYWLILSVIWQ